MMFNLEEGMSALCKVSMCYHHPSVRIKGMLIYAFTKGGDAKPAPG